MIDAVVPAYNEALTIADVVNVLKASGLVRVIVVSDGSTDGTPDRAREAGADEVVELFPNVGKAQAMTVGITHARTDPVAFFDADLDGFRTDHVARLVSGAEHGFDMVCGLRDYGIANAWQLVGPLITGERIVRRWVLDRIPTNCWRGYAIETAMNETCSRHGARVLAVPLPGLKIRGKVKKTGVLKGLWNHAVMFSQIMQTECSIDEHGDCRAADV